MVKVKFCGFYDLLAALFCLLSMASFSSPSYGQRQTGDGQEKLKFGVLLSGGAQDRTVNRAIRHFAERAAAQINRQGGVFGRDVEVKFLDGGKDREKTLKYMQEFIGDRNLIGIVGLNNSTHGKYVFERIGAAIDASHVPIVTDISVSWIYAAHKNVFSMTSAMDDELEAVRALLKDKGVSRPVFIGKQDDLYSASLGDGLAKPDSEPKLVLEASVKVATDDSIAAEELDELTRKVVQAQADMAILAVESVPGAQVLKELVRAGIKVPVLVLYGRVAIILDNLKGISEEKLPSEFYQLARDGVPNVFNERLRKEIWKSRSFCQWIFEDRYINATSTPSRFAEEHCKAHIHTAENSRAIGRGMQYSDILHFMAELAGSVPRSEDIQSLRVHIARQLNLYREGREVYRGLWQDWTFTENRAAASDILIAKSAAKPKSMALAPFQYLRVNASLIKSPVVDISIDLIRLARIDSNERQFDAEFYLSLRSLDNSVSIADFDFTNASRSKFSRERLLDWREIYDGNSISKFSKGVKVYKIYGTFQFVPELDNYPFDRQRLSISFQAKDAANPFLIQPSLENLRRLNGILDGWSLQERYVGSEKDIISTLTADAHGRRVIPIYKFNHIWVAERISVDYYIRVIVPMGFILLVTHFSTFLPLHRFEPAIAIQVTALLSSIALYLALPEIESDQATLSDRMFILTYAAIASTIGFTILKDNRSIVAHGALRWGVAIFQRFVFPVLVVAIVLYLVVVTDTDKDSAADLWSFRM